MPTTAVPRSSPTGRHGRSPARVRRVTVVLLLLVGSVAGPALASTGQADAASSAQVFLWLAVILLAAQAGGDLAARVGQPAVLGELLAGVVIGNLGLVGLPALAPLATDPSVELLARVGVLLLLFEVGLESTVS
jgi:hypothetical protein